MPEREPTTQTLEADDARRQWGQLLDKVSRREARIVLERGGVPLAALVAAEDLERMIRIEAERAERFAIIDEIHARNADCDPDEVERDVAQEIAAMREERRQRAPDPGG